MIEKLLSLIQRKPEVLPATEPISRVINCEIVRGSNYLVKEPKVEFSMKIFASLVKGKCQDCDHPEAFPCESVGCERCTLFCTCKNCSRTRAQGLCFSMRSPEETRMMYTLQTTPVFWISNHGTDRVSPSDLELIADMIGSFLKKSKNAVILLDGVEYLIAINGFIPVFKMLRDIQEWTILNCAVFLLSVNPASLEKKEMALIERNMKDLSLQGRFPDWQTYRPE
jgi:hypothetical protein